MADVLARIVARKRREVAARLGGPVAAHPTTRSLRAALARPGARFVMEVKRASPSGHRSAVGVQEALVVHGSGLDEVALHGETRAIRLSNGTMAELELTPEDAGLERAPLITVTGGDAEENAVRLRLLLAGQGSRAENDIVALNAGALLLTAGRTGSLKEAVGLASEALLSAKAGAVLDAYIGASNG